MDLDETADALYALPLADFVAQRDAYAREAKAAGEPDLAKAIGALRRPTAGARLANLLVRELRPETEELVALGAALREAQADLDAEQLKELGRQRQQVVHALATRAAKLSRDHGEPAVQPSVAKELEGTLTAALADPDAAEQLLAGRLVRSLSYAGLGFGERSTEAPGGPKTTRAPRKRAASVAAVADDDGEAAALAAKVDAAERDLAQARLQAAEAQAQAEAAVQAHQAAQQAVTATTAELARVRDELAALESRLRDDESALADATRARDAAVEEQQAADKLVDDAGHALDTLRTPARPSRRS